MNHVYQYEDGTFLTPSHRPSVDLQEASVGSKASVRAQSGAVTTRRKWQKLPKLVGKAVPVVLLSHEDFNEMQQSVERLAALEAGGVDNWEGYSEALRGFYGEDDE
jgi:hypothetical protein